MRTYVDRKFEAAVAAGHELYVIAPGPEDSFDPRPGGGVVTVRCPPLPFDANYWMFWNAAPVHARLDELAPDLVEASSPWRGAWLAADWRGPAPRAMFVHAEPVAVYPQRWFGRALSRRRIDALFGGYWAYLNALARRFDATVAGTWLSGRLTANGVSPVTAIDLGIDRQAFSPSLRDPALRAELLAACGLPADAILLLGVGRFHGQKRWPLVIEAVAQAKARSPRPLGLVIVGDGMGRRAVEAAAAGRPWVHLTGAISARDRVAAIMASADALVHGCESETYGLVLGEAAASGLPLVLPDWGAATHFADAATTESYASGDAASAADAVGRLLARDPACLQAASLRAAAQVRADSTHYAELFDFYADLVRTRGAGR